MACGIGVCVMRWLFGMVRRVVSGLVMLTRWFLLFGVRIVLTMWFIFGLRFQ